MGADSAYCERAEHPFVAPPELHGDSRRYPVLIVGAGPVGLAAAACLARFGIETVVIERNRRAGEGSRAICLSRRSLEILDWIGVANLFVAKGLGWTRGRAFYRERQIHELCMPHGDTEKFLPMTNLQQYYMEEFLAQHCATQPLVGLRWGSELVDLERRPQEVVATIATPEGSYRLSCSYLLATDGARSQVRKRLGLPFEGSSFTGRYLIADIRLRSAHPTERRAWFDPPSNRGSTILMHRQPDEVWRIDYQLHDTDDEVIELQPQSVRSRVQRHLDFIGERGEWELLWSSIYRARSLALRTYVHGRILFAGDAAHLVPIFGVRGLNSGFADAHNLAWKLAWVLHGRAGDSLLETYTQERRAATLEIHRQADKTTRFMTPRTRGDLLMRDAALSLAVEHEFVRPLVDPRQSVPYVYGDSPLNSFGSGNAPASGADFRNGPRPGAPLPNLRVRHRSGSGYLLDWLGSGFVGIFFIRGECTPADREVLADLHARCNLRLLVVTDVRPDGRFESDDETLVLLQDVANVAGQIYGACAGTLYLARPDGHVCARWKRAVTAELIGAMQRACAAC
ncbi:MAG: FAD-dependent monooxygenase [Steroidobacteraceae bacterium]